VQGSIIKTILKESERLDIDLIIMGCHKHGRLYGALMDNTEEGLLSKCTHPVMFVPAPD
jgi:nucleotide-binding universal stress UspA family protein